MASYQYIYVMKDLCKAWPGGKEVLKHIWLSFYPGAKIGVLGVNGAGKSTLLKIMAGLDKDFTGEAWAADGVRVGYLEQEPKLDPNKTVMENVMDGVAEVRDLLKRYEEVNMKFADPDCDMDALLAEQAELQEKIDACNGWELERTLEIAMDACVVHRQTGLLTSCQVANVVAWLCVVCFYQSRICCCWMNRQIIWMPNRWNGCNII